MRCCMNSSGQVHREKENPEAASHVPQVSRSAVRGPAMRIIAISTPLSRALLSPVLGSLPLPHKSKELSYKFLVTSLGSYQLFLWSILETRRIEFFRNLRRGLIGLH